MSISGESDAPAPRRTPAAVVAAWFTNALKRTYDAAVIEPPEPKSKFEMFEESRGEGRQQSP